MAYGIETVEGIAERLPAGRMKADSLIEVQPIAAVPCTFPAVKTSRLRIPALLSLLVAVALVAVPATASAKPKRHRVDVDGRDEERRGSDHPRRPSSTAARPRASRSTTAGSSSPSTRPRQLQARPGRSGSATPKARRSARSTWTIDARPPRQPGRLRRHRRVHRRQGRLQGDQGQGPEGPRPQHARRPERDGRVEGLRHLLSDPARPSAGGAQPDGEDRRRSTGILTGPWRESFAS